MKTFKEYREEKNKRKSPKEVIETVFGSHSKKRTNESLDTSFGSHSIERLNEELEKSDDKERTKAAHTNVHEKIAPMGELNHVDKEHVRGYTDYSFPLNKTLRDYHEGQSLNPDHKDHIDAMTRILNSNKTKEDTHVYTGLKSSPAKHFTPVNGKIPTTVERHQPLFASTSSSLEMARSFSEDVKHKNDPTHGIEHHGEEGSRHVLKIHIPKGSSAASVRHLSFVPGEHEIVLNRGHDMEIHHKPEYHVSPKGEKTYIWHAKVSGHSPANLEGEDL
jgi:hypothetical protein